MGLRAILEAALYGTPRSELDEEDRRWRREMKNHGYNSDMYLGDYSDEEIDDAEHLIFGMYYSAEQFSEGDRPPYWRI